MARRSKFKVLEDDFRDGVISINGLVKELDKFKEPYEIKYLIEEYYESNLISYSDYMRLITEYSE